MFAWFQQDGAKAHAAISCMVYVLLEAQIWSHQIFSGGINWTSIHWPLERVNYKCDRNYWSKYVENGFLHMCRGIKLCKEVKGDHIGHLF